MNHRHLENAIARAHRLIAILDEHAGEPVTVEMANRLTDEAWSNVGAIDNGRGKVSPASKVIVRSLLVRRAMERAA